MGCTISNNVVQPNNSGLQDVSDIPQHTWRLVADDTTIRERFTNDCTLDPKDNDPLHLELRCLLDDPSAQSAIARYAEQLKVLDLFMCWIDVQEYKFIPTHGYRRSKAIHIFNKYIDVDAVLSVGGIPDPERFRIRDVIEQARTDPKVLDPHFYDKVQSICFKEMYHNIYLPFKNKKEYEILCTKLRDKYNRVVPEDFEYFTKLGDCHTHGFIVRCRKKSTGKYYAMKIQNKKESLLNFKEDMRLVNREKQAFSRFQHPFIVNMDYSFQTQSLVFMATSLALGGDLKTLLENSTLGRLNEDRVQFYAAEIVLSLSHMHALGMVYRDLKPQHILLAADGNIKLADVSGIVYEDGGILSPQGGGLLHLFASNVPTVKSMVQSGAQKAEERKRMKRTSVMGVLGDMAPEMVLRMNEKKKEQIKALTMSAKLSASSGSSKKLKALTASEPDHYSKSVDWWSLGVTLYTLLTGSRPFKDEVFTDFVNMCASEKYNSVQLQSEDYASLFNKIDFPWYVSSEAKNFITRLLDVDEKTRLGSGLTGDEDVRSHAFFNGVNWEKLEQRHVEPPVIVGDKLSVPDEHPIEFSTMLGVHDKSHWLDDLPLKEYQEFFNTWDFVSAHTIRVESGLANTMDQYDNNFKIRRILGDKDNTGGRKADPTTPRSKKGNLGSTIRSTVVQIISGSSKKTKPL